MQGQDLRDPKQEYFCGHFLREFEPFCRTKTHLAFPLTSLFNGNACVNFLNIIFNDKRGAYAKHLRPLIAAFRHFCIKVLLHFCAFALLPFRTFGNLLQSTFLPFPVAGVGVGNEIK